MEKELKQFIVAAKATIHIEGKETEVPVTLDIKAETKEEANSIAYGFLKGAGLSWNYEVHEANATITKAVTGDFYQIYYDPNGNKVIHILGYLYKGDPDYKNVELTWACMGLNDFCSEYLKNPEFVNEIYQDCDQYEDGDLNEDDAVRIYNTYFDGQPPVRKLQFKDLTPDTPYGNYFNED